LQHNELWLTGNYVCTLMGVVHAFSFHTTDQVMGESWCGSMLLDWNTIKSCILLN